MKKKNISILIAGILILISSLILIIGNNKPLDNKNYTTNSDMNLRQYSDINEVTSENTTLEDKTTNISEIASSPKPEPTNKTMSINTNNKEYGTWVWVTPTKITNAYREKVLKTAAENNINVIYLTIDDYLDIHTLPDGPVKDAKKKAYGDAIEVFIKAANAKGIEVDAEAGLRDWAQPENLWKPRTIVEYAKEYNSSRTYTFRGMQYDIEPYLLSTYTTDENKAAILKNFVALVDETVTRLKGSDLAFSVVIPHFYDSKQAWTPTLTYKDINTHAYSHILRILNTRKDSSIIIMAYRNFAEGEDGSIELSEIEVAEASNSGGATKVIIAQETGNVEPDYVTFYATSREEYLLQVSKIKSALGGYKNYGGISVHYIDPFIELE